jgi:hypothetical protein
MSYRNKNINAFHHIVQWCNALSLVDGFSNDGFDVLVALFWRKRLQSCAKTTYLLITNHNHSSKKNKKIWLKGGLKSQLQWAQEMILLDWRDKLTTPPSLFGCGNGKHIQHIYCGTVRAKHTPQQSIIPIIDRRNCVIDKTLARRP